MRPRYPICEAPNIFWDRERLFWPILLSSKVGEIPLSQHEIFLLMSPMMRYQGYNPLRISHSSKGRICWPICKSNGDFRVHQPRRLGWDTLLDAEPASQAYFLCAGTAIATANLGSPIWPGSLMWNALHGLVRPLDSTLFCQRPSLHTPSIPVIPSLLPGCMAGSGCLWAAWSLQSATIAGARNPSLVPRAWGSLKLPNWAPGWKGILHLALPDLEKCDLFK